MEQTAQLSIDFSTRLKPMPPLRPHPEVSPFFVDLKHRVLAVLKNHEGEAEAILGIDIARPLGYKDDRMVRRAIKSLVEDDGYWISSKCTGKHRGFFMEKNGQSGFDCSDSLFRRAMSILRRYARAKKITAREISTQIELAWDQPEEEE